MSLHKIGITNDSLSGNGAKVTLDGRPLHGVTSLDLHVSVDEPNRVTLDLWVDGINADVEAEVKP